MIDLYKEYVKEREDREIEVFDDLAFVTYKKLEHKQDGLVGYLMDMYVRKGHRDKGYHVKMLEHVADWCVENDLNVLYTSVDLSTNGSTHSLKVILHHGFKADHTDGNMIYFRKQLEV